MLFFTRSSSVFAVSKSGLWGADGQKIQQMITDRTRDWVTGGPEGQFFSELLYCQLWILFQALIEFFFFLAALKCHFIISSFCSIFYLSLYLSFHGHPIFCIRRNDSTRIGNSWHLGLQKSLRDFSFLWFHRKGNFKPFTRLPSVTHPWTLWTRESRLIYEVTLYISHLHCWSKENISMSPCPNFQPHRGLCVDVQRASTSSDWTSQFSHCRTDSAPWIHDGFVVH